MNTNKIVIHTVYKNSKLMCTDLCIAKRALWVLKHRQIRREKNGRQKSIKLLVKRYFESIKF